jgi:hypothetical protein
MNQSQQRFVHGGLPRIAWRGYHKKEGGEQGAPVGLAHDRGKCLTSQIIGTLRPFDMSGFRVNHALRLLLLISPIVNNYSADRDFSAKFS